MRKGTHSCTECEAQSTSDGIPRRLLPNSGAFLSPAIDQVFPLIAVLLTFAALLGRRRKIRCSFLPGTSACSPCSARGSRCVDQRNESLATAEREVISLRERVARLESLLENKPQLASGERVQDVRPLNLLPDTAESSADTGDLVSGKEHRAPFVSALDDAGLLWPPSSGADETSKTQALPNPASSANTCSSTMRSSITPSHPTTISQLFRPPEQKARRVCETLRSVLPDYDTLLSVLSTNGAWWSSFRYKTHAIAQTPVEALTAFAARSYTSNNPAGLGILVAAYARSSNQNQRLYATVESLVVSDFAYSATIEGLECLVLLAKSYIDIGQPRRAWLMYRKGMAIAQLMGLYRKGADFLSRERVWWAVYHGDRFTSMLLGLPYGFNDAHYGPTMGAMAEESESWELRFILRCAFISGKVIDRNITPGKPTLASTIDLDEQMDAIAASAPEGWWDIPAELPGPGSELDLLRERLLQQFFFFHVRIYLHLPFMVKSSTSVPYDISRLACLEASRQMLRRFLILRAEVRGACVFECKTSDFVGFMATVVLLIGLSSLGDAPNLRGSDEDSHLITSVERIFHKEEREKGCKIASQCRKVLWMLSGIQDDNSPGADSFAEPHKILIPYFGNVLRRRVKRDSAQTLSDEGRDNPSSLPMALEPTGSYTTEEQSFLADAYAIEYMGCNLPNSVHWDVTNPDGVTAESLPPWLDMAMTDIDQDWSMFLDADNFSL